MQIKILIAAGLIIFLFGSGFTTGYKIANAKHVKLENKMLVSSIKSDNEDKAALTTIRTKVDGVTSSAKRSINQIQYPRVVDSADLCSGLWSVYQQTHSSFPELFVQQL